LKQCLNPFTTFLAVAPLDFTSAANAVSNIEVFASTFMAHDMIEVLGANKMLAEIGLDLCTFQEIVSALEHLNSFGSLDSPAFLQGRV
jgi:hypothetical protein